MIGAMVGTLLVIPIANIEPFYAPIIAGALDYAILFAFLGWAISGPRRRKQGLLAGLFVGILPGLIAGFLRSIVGQYYDQRMPGVFTLLHACEALAAFAAGFFGSEHRRWLTGLGVAVVFVAGSLLMPHLTIIPRELTQYSQLFFVINDSLLMGLVGAATGLVAGACRGGIEVDLRY